MVPAGRYPRSNHKRLSFCSSLSDSGLHSQLRGSQIESDRQQCWHASRLINEYAPTTAAMTTKQKNRVVIFQAVFACSPSSGSTNVATPWWLTDEHFVCRRTLVLSGVSASA